MSILEKSLFYNYLPCSSAHALRFLANEIDITPLFWCSYEPVYSVYEAIVQDNKTPWEYTWDIKPFDKDMGILQEIVFSDNFQFIKQKIINLLENGYTVQIRTKNRNIPHMVELNSNLEGVHTLTLTSYDDTKDVFKIYDFPFEKEYSSEILQKAYDQVSSNFITYYRLEKDATTIENISTHYQLFKSRMLKINDDFSIYEELKTLLYQGNDLKEKLVYFFGVIALSRELTFIYMINNNLSEYLVDSIKKITNLAEIIKQLMLKYSIKGFVSEKDTFNSIRKINDLQKMELEFLNAIRDEFLSGEKRELIKKYPNPPIDIQVNHITDSSAWLSWNNKEDEQYEQYTYNIQLNSIGIASTNKTTFIINNLKPETSYFVSISSVDSSGQFSKEVKVESFKTSDKKIFGDLSRFKFVSASSYEDDDRAPHNVVDNDESTRWSSAYSDNEWICIDLGYVMRFNKVKLHWEDAHALEYKVQISVDMENWIDIHYEQDCKGGIEEIEYLKHLTRYVRVLGIKRATIFGYSLWEFSIYNEE
ncbi:discoidin domain-containing protein [Paenibacillus lutimineralis]|uniref:F5/8 type C domain-containing protein n=1 Tax=Paenibacillus lutimineralis TaxID=2707005 RepID=A0A3S9V166_9BACL|nr:discoidin domain-containing protein [Paenibacillus lutimineralis]AZS16344.1 hypothetical protein EI981_19095 [Paenibacillus lutimineralis]